MKLCTRCILPETFPGISFNDEGLCTHCARHSARAVDLSAEKRACAQRFAGLLNTVGTAAAPTPAFRQRSYDVLMAYSGGKDSTYTMTLLAKRYGLRVLALSFDNGFISDTASRNIATVTGRLGVDHIFFRPAPGLLRRVFTAAAERELYAKKTLERASTICTSCIGLVKSLCLKTAIELGIPLVGFGWSPGQAPIESAIMRNNPSLARMAQQAIQRPLHSVAGGEVDRFFLAEWHYTDAERFPWNVHPMAWEFYQEEMILDEIAELGWKMPDDTDSNSTNCLLNALANDLHVKQYRFHPYVWEIANMVRDGIMPRDQGYAKIYGATPERLIRDARAKLGL